MFGKFSKHIALTWPWVNYVELNRLAKEVSYKSTGWCVNCRDRMNSIQLAQSRHTWGLAIWAVALIIAGVIVLLVFTPGACKCIPS